MAILYGNHGHWLPGHDHLFIRFGFNVVSGVGGKMVVNDLAILR